MELGHAWQHLDEEAVVLYLEQVFFENIYEYHWHHSWENGWNILVMAGSYFNEYKFVLATYDILKKFSLIFSPFDGWTAIILTTPCLADSKLSVFMYNTCLRKDFSLAKNSQKETQILTINEKITCTKYCLISRKWSSSWLFYRVSPSLEQFLTAVKPVKSNESFSFAIIRSVMILPVGEIYNFQDQFSDMIQK